MIWQGNGSCGCRPVLLAPTPRVELTAFQPGSESYACPVVTGKRIYINDQDSARLWTIQ